VLVGRARKIEKFLGQPMYVAENFTGMAGTTVPIDETVEAFEKLSEGEFDDVPEQAFVAVGGIDDMLARAEKLEG
jgi:F-type H+-transporting ATPase subunit beta